MRSDDAPDAPREELSAREQAVERILTEVLDDALGVYGHLLTAEELAYARELLGDMLATHPATSALIEQLVPAPELDASDKIATSGAEEATADDDVRGASG